MRAGPDRRESLADVVADIRDGTRLALCGFAITRNAVAFAHELVRARRHRLSLTQVIGGMETDLLVAAGAVDDLSYGGGSLDRFGPLHAVNRAAMAGTLRLVEYSALALTLRLHAGALGLPFIATRSLLGSDLAQALIAGGHARLAEDPFDGTPCLVLPPLRTDVAVVHVDVADTAGNAVIAGPTWSIPETVRAADTVIVLAEEVVDVGAIDPSHVHIPAALVHAVVAAPRGAYPTAVFGRYDYDGAHLRRYAQAAADAAGTAAYLDEWVFGTGTFDAFLSKAAA
ncbi:MAG TPA: CoA-transferase [Natronosporangium sp.]|nr:CoA-transferase [Natronosporangium sp.]